MISELFLSQQGQASSQLFDQPFISTYPNPKVLEASFLHRGGFLDVIIVHVAALGHVGRSMILLSSMAASSLGIVKALHSLWKGQANI